MCDSCGCGPEQGHEALQRPGGERTIEVEQDVLAVNNRFAAENRGYFARNAILALNLVSSPGSGKTTLLEQTIRQMEDVSLSVIEGDQQTRRDAERIESTGAPVVQINTGAGCHLDAHMVQHALEGLALQKNSILLIENVGNLVCPAMFDLGEAAKVVIISVTEGDDKPLKYPGMFSAADICIINKIDLLPYVDFQVDRCRDFAGQVNGRLTFFELSAKTGEGMQTWIDWLRKQIDIIMAGE